MDVEKQVQYWKEVVVDDLESVDVLLRGKKINHALLFAHLALEKALKAHVCLATKEHPPYTRNLDRLAKASRLDLTEDQIQVLAEASPYNLRGRYTIPTTPLLSPDRAREMLKRIGGLGRWLNKK